MDVKSTWIPTWHGMDHVGWSLGRFSKTTSWEVGLIQNRKIMALQMLTTVGLFYLIMCEDLHEKKIHCNSIRLRAMSHITSHYTWGPVTTLHDVGGELGWPLDTFLLGSQILTVTALGLCVWSGPNYRPRTLTGYMKISFCFSLYLLIWICVL